MKLAIFAHPEAEGLTLDGNLLLHASELVIGAGQPLEAEARRYAREAGLPLRIVPARADIDAQREEILRFAPRVLVICARGEYMDVPGARRAWALGLSLTFRYAHEFTRA